jgi:hypothetical protein
VPRIGRPVYKKSAFSRFNFSYNTYSTRTAPQRYGPGTKLQNLEFFATAVNNSYVNFNSIFVSSAEHQLNKTMYNYFKILNLAVVFPPQQASVSSNRMVFQVNWNNGDTYGIQFEENSKWVPLYRTHDYVFKFVPPDIPLLLGDNTSPIVLNMNNYIRTTDNFVFPGSIYFSSNNDSGSAIFRIIIKVEYRGSKLPDSEGLKKYIEQVDNLKNLYQKGVQYKELTNEQEIEKDEEVASDAERKVVCVKQAGSIPTIDVSLYPKNIISQDGLRQNHSGPIEPNNYGCDKGVGSVQSIGAVVHDKELGGCVFSSETPGQLRPSDWRQCRFIEATHEEIRKQASIQGK